MKASDVLNIASMPIASPTYPRGPYRFVGREYLIITYESDATAIRHLLPEPLIPDGSNNVIYEFARMPDSSGFGSYTQTGVVIPCLLNNVPMHHVSQMYLDCEPPIAGGREIWGFPQKLGQASLNIVQDTLTGKLTYAGQTVAIGTMAYKHENLLDGGHANEIEALAKRLMHTRVNLKLIPHVDGTPALCQLVAYNMIEAKVKGAWAGPARLELFAHVNAPLADLPVRKVIGGMHVIADITLPYGRIVHDYLKGM
jgi:acetoacetate decarboxylase